jgi:anti-sigma B factor antagonist
MFSIERADDGRIVLQGRLDAAQADKAREVLDTVHESCALDFQELDYISSAGLGVLLGAQRRLSVTGQKLVLENMNRHVRELFRIAGFDQVFQIR